MPPFSNPHAFEEYTMEISAGLVKELRERTGLGMMECKKALVEAGGNIETAIDNLRKSGQAKAAKKAGRTAAEGAVVTAGNGGTAVLVEVNSETDFVGRDASFLAFANDVAKAALASGETDVAKLAAANGGAIESARLALIQKIGENIQIRRIARLTGDVVGTYIHSGKIGVLAAVKGGNADLGKDLAMHIAAANPLVVNPADVPADVLAREKEIYAAKAAESGKPANIVEKMVEGSLRKYMSEVSLTEQAFVKDPDTKVGDLVKKAGATVQQFIRFEVGEGIEKEVTDFAAEVASMTKGV
ncbi:MAG: translation elongation factor Ts [Pseudomonadota bacterium]